MYTHEHPHIYNTIVRSWITIFHPIKKEDFSSDHLEYIQKRITYKKTGVIFDILCCVTKLFSAG